MTARVVQMPRTGRSGRQPANVEAARDAREDLTAHCAEAIAFVDRAWPHVSALERMATEIGPTALRHALALGALLASYERRHVGNPDEPELAVVAA